MEEKPVKPSRLKKNPLAAPAAEPGPVPSIAAEPGPVPSTAAEPGPRPPAPGPAPVDKKTKPRLSIPVNDDGTFAWESMRDDTKESLRRALGSDVPASGPAPSTMSRASLQNLTNVSLATLSSISGLVATIGIPQEYQASLFKAASFTDDEIAMLREPTTDLLAKYAGGMDEWAAEAAFALALVSIAMKKAQVISEGRRAILRRVAEQRQQANAPAPQVATAPAGPNSAGAA